MFTFEGICSMLTFGLYLAGVAAIVTSTYVGDRAGD
jgi:hypothetical protein